MKHRTEAPQRPGQADSHRDADGLESRSKK